MLSALRRLEEHETTVVLATHDVDLALAWAHEAAVVTSGRVRQGDPVEVLGDTELLAAARLRLPWVLDFAQRLGLDRDPDAAPLRDLNGLAERLGEHRGGPSVVDPSADLNINTPFDGAVKIAPDAGQAPG